MHIGNTCCHSGRRKRQLILPGEVFDVGDSVRWQTERQRRRRLALGGARWGGRCSTPPPVAEYPSVEQAPSHPSQSSIRSSGGRRDRCGGGCVLVSRCEDRRVGHEHSHNGVYDAVHVAVGPLNVHALIRVPSSAVLGGAVAAVRLAFYGPVSPKAVLLPCLVRVTP